MTPRNTHREYPRPRLRRARWHNLNGLWDVAVTNADATRPKAFTSRILVPFPVESSLSGVGRRVAATERVWYRRGFVAPELAAGERLLLHFGAADWHAIVWIDGTKVGEHRGGYDPFSFDVTEALKNGAKHEIVVAVTDPTDNGYQACGKQVTKPGGIWYTPVTGIWQTVWLEPVPRAYVARLRVTPDTETSMLHIRAESKGAGLDATIRARAFDGDEQVAQAAGRASATLDLKVPRPAKLWTPEMPFLYRLEVELVDGSTSDTVGSSFGMRAVTLGKDAAGHTRILLNGKPRFQLGTLDQGYWPDGLYTPPSDAAMRHDLDVLKRMGFNMLRKHVKVEPERYYDYCDRIGLLVWQDMPSGDRHAKQRSATSTKQYFDELGAIMDALHGHPSIVVWVPFNEGWGQFDTERVAAWTKRRDPSRLVIPASGWHDAPAGDIRDVHSYPGPAIPPPAGSRARVLGEFGGLGLPVAGHTWLAKKSWGYRRYETSADLLEAYTKLITKLRVLAASGLSAAVYTQTTDVETEVNGLMTYDRAVTKLDPAALEKLNASCIEAGR